MKKSGKSGKNKSTYAHEEDGIVFELVTGESLWVLAEDVVSVLSVKPAGERTLISLNDGATHEIRFNFRSTIELLLRTRKLGGF